MFVIITNVLCSAMRLSVAHRWSWVHDWSHVKMCRCYWILVIIQLIIIGGSCNYQVILSNAEQTVLSIYSPTCWSFQWTLATRASQVSFGTGHWFTKKVLILNIINVSVLDENLVSMFQMNVSFLA